MQHKTLLALATVHQWCLAEDKSTEYTLQLMQDTCNVNLDTALKYLNIEPYHHKQLFDEINLVLSIIDKIELSNVMHPDHFIKADITITDALVKHRTGGQ